MDKNKKKHPTEKRHSQTSTTPSSLTNSPVKRRRSSNSTISKISQITSNNKSFSPSPRRKPMKKVTFKTDFIQIVVVDSYKKYNNPEDLNNDMKCRCVII